MPCQSAAQQWSTASAYYGRMCLVWLTPAAHPREALLVSQGQPTPFPWCLPLLVQAQVLRGTTQTTPGASSLPMALSWAKLGCTSWPMVSPASTQSLAQCSTPMMLPRFQEVSLPDHIDFRACDSPCLISLRNAHEVVRLAYAISCLVLTTKDVFRSHGVQACFPWCRHIQTQTQGEALIVASACIWPDMHLAGSRSTLASCSDFKDRPRHVQEAAEALGLRWRPGLQLAAPAQVKHIAWQGSCSDICMRAAVTKSAMHEGSCMASSGQRCEGSACLSGDV